MRRRTILAGAGVALSSSLVGCLDSNVIGGRDDGYPNNENHEYNGGESTISEQFDCSDAFRPEPNVEAGVAQNGGHESVGSTAYPTPPEALNVDTVPSFVRTHEKAYQQNEFVSSSGESLVGFNVRIEETELFDYHEGIAVVRLDFLVDLSTYSEGRLATTEAFGEAAVYAVDETGLVRVATDSLYTYDNSDQQETPDPLRTGTLLVCFNQTS
ncbi:MAG: hypothetical protein IH933_08790 [Euryarchaeota archaeon]|jgi:hypothetical protein|nr:hypothetical protein [Euryarchaeota archaeon]